MVKLSSLRNILLAISFILLLKGSQRLEETKLQMPDSEFLLAIFRNAKYLSVNQIKLHQMALD